MISFTSSSLKISTQKCVLHHNIFFFPHLFLVLKVNQICLPQKENGINIRVSVCLFSFISSHTCILHKRLHNIKMPVYLISMKAQHFGLPFFSGIFVPENNAFLFLYLPARCSFTGTKYITVYRCCLNYCEELCHSNIILLVWPR